MKCKYIVFKSDPIPVMVIFPTFVSHDSIKRRMQLDVLGAGFIEYGKCHGESESMHIPMRADDQDIYDIFFKDKTDGQ